MKNVAIALGAVLVAIGASLATPLAPKLFPTFEGPMFWIGCGVAAFGVAITLAAFFLSSQAAVSVNGASVTHVVSSTGQTGGITAHTVHMAPPRRSLKDPEVCRLLKGPVSELDPSQKVLVGWPAGDEEAGSFAEEIARMLEGQGGRVSRQMFAVSGAPTGVQTFPDTNQIFVGPRDRI